MTLRFVLDTNICIFAIKNKPGAVRQALNRRPGQLCVSAITAMELRYGAENQQPRPGTMPSSTDS